MLFSNFYFNMKWWTVQRLHDFKLSCLVCKDIQFWSKRFMWLHLWWFHFNLNYYSELNSRRSKVRCCWWPNILEKSYVLYLEFIILLRVNWSEVVTLVAKYPFTFLILEILCMSCLCSSIILEACQCKNATYMSWMRNSVILEECMR